MACFRKLLHLPIVVLCANSDGFVVLLQGVQQRLRQSCRLAPHLAAPDTRDIYFGAWSPNLAWWWVCSVSLGPTRHLTSHTAPP